jgi:hypothetical protein
METAASSLPLVEQALALLDVLAQQHMLSSEHDGSAAHAVKQA